MKTACLRRLSCALVLATIGAALVAPALSGQSAKLPRVVASANHTLIILPSGAVKVFARSNEAGQLGLGALGRSDWDHPVADRDFSDEGVYLPGVDDAVDGAAGPNFSLLLRTNGTVLAWGANSQGQLGIGVSGEAVPRPTPIPLLSHVRQLAAGGAFSLALLEDGSVQAWGNCIGEEQACQQPRPRTFAGLTGVKAIAAGGDFALALAQDGTVRAWGINKWGQIGDEKISRSGVPVKVPGIENAVAVSGGDGYALALLSDGTVRVWGQGTTDGAYFAGARSPSIHDDASPWTAIPVAVPGLRSVAAVSAGAAALALLQDGTVRAWGYDGFYAMGLGTMVEYRVRVLPLKVSRIAAIATGFNRSYFVQQDGTVLAAGVHRLKRDESFRVPTVILSSAEAMSPLQK
jgi:alpha-tubulin suppressor-like RCC1 family protein